MKKFLISFLLCILCLFSFTACNDGQKPNPDDNNLNNNTRDDSAWFSAEELQAVGLSGLTSAEGLTSTMHTSADGLMWQIYYSQPASETDLEPFAQKVYNVLLANSTSARFGVDKMTGSNANNDEYYYVFDNKTSLADYYDTNPSPKYVFYYTTATQLDENGYYPTDSVYEIDVRYEDECLKMIVKYAYKDNFKKLFK